MVFEHIDKLKQEYTDKYVVVDDSRPELRRFKGQTGQVKTVNMSGRALVQFDAYDNIGWYDIEVDYLKVVEAPLPKAPEKAAAAPASKKAPQAPETKKAPTPAPPKTEKVEAKPAGKMSVADILAAARGEKSPGSAAAKAAPPSKPKQEVQTKSPAAPAKKPDAKKMSVDDILAAARSEKSLGAASPKTPPAAKEKEPKEKEPKEKKPADKGQKETPATPRQPDAAVSPKKKIDTPKMTVEQMLAAARAEGMGRSASSTAAVTASPRQESITAKPQEHEPVASARATSATQSAPKPQSSGSLPTDTAGIIAWCRQHDSN